MGGFHVLFRHESTEASKHHFWCHVLLETSWEETCLARRKKLNTNSGGHKTDSHLNSQADLPVYSRPLYSHRHEHCSDPFHWHSTGRTMQFFHLTFEIFSSPKIKISKLTGFHGTRRIIIVFESSIICGGLWHMAWRWGWRAVCLADTSKNVFFFISHFCSFSTGHMIQLWSACLLGAMHWWKLAAKDNNMHTIPKLKTRRSNDKSKKRWETPYINRI